MRVAELVDAVVVCESLNYKGKGIVFLYVDLAFALLTAEITYCCFNFATINGMCTIELHHGGWFENGVYKKGKVCYLDNIIENFLSLLDLLKIGRGDVDISQVEQCLEIRCKNPEGGLELIEDYEYDADAENCDGDLTQNYQVKEVNYIEVEDEETFENVGTKVANEDAIKEVPNEDAGA
ncbi:unnamed protein product [Prunus brigantina]